MRVSILFLLTLILSLNQISVFGQIQGNTAAGMQQYERPSVTYCLLHFEGEKYADKLKENFPKVGVNEKFNNHNLPQFITFSAPYARYDAFSQKEIIKQKLESANIGKEVVAKWFSRKKDGSFSMELIAQRGLYNATDADVLAAKAGKRGSALLEDKGEILLSKSYILAFDFNNMETWDDYYDRQDAKNLAIAVATNTKPRKVNRMYYGYRANMTAYIYKLDWNDSLAAEFYKNAWSNPSYFDKMTFPIKYVDQVMVPNADGSRLAIYGGGDDELMQKLVSDGIEKGLVEASINIPEFRVRIPIYATRPLQAKIGLKEDVTIDQRFFVYEMVEMEDKKLVPRRRGVVRATKHITDNRNVATGETKPTRFYQESGKRIYPGMLLEQHYDYGISFAGGWGLRSLQGPMIRIDYNLSRLFNVSLFRFFIEGQIGGASLRLGNGTKSYSAISYFAAAGFSKEYVLTRNIHIEPYVSVVYDTTSLSLNQQEKNAFYSVTLTGLNPGVAHIGAMAGIRLPINLSYNLQIVPAISVSTVLFSKYTSLFSDKLTESLKTYNPEFIKDAGIDTTDPNWRNNTDANLNRNWWKWEILLRFKF